MGTPPLNRHAQLFNRGNHIAIIDFQPLGGLFTRRIKRGAFTGVQPDNRRQRPVGAGNLGRGGDDQRRLAQRHKHLTALRIGPFMPKAGRLKTRILLKRCHGPALLGPFLRPA